MMRENEPWTWVRTQGKGRVFYTASGHDQRTWGEPEFVQLLKSGILWSVGDAMRGRTVFHEHPIASCIRCHKIGGEGGDVGPMLDGLASRKEAAYIRESVIDPNAAMAEGYNVEVSPMPPVGVLLPRQELEDLIAYLMTLKE